MSDLWNDERTVREAGYDVPAWIEQDITMQDVAAIAHGGCASGAYMPAVTYCDARQTMAEHGDEVLDYVNDALGETLRFRDDESWHGVAVSYLSCAVELWAHGVESAAVDA